MNPEELETLITEIRDNHEDQAVITEKLQAIRQGFNTVNTANIDIQAKYEDTHSKYFEALEVNGRLNSQLSYQRDPEKPEIVDPPKPKNIKELFKPEINQN